MNNLIQNNTVIYTENIDRLAYITYNDDWYYYNIPANAKIFRYRDDFNNEGFHTYSSNITNHYLCKILNTTIPANTSTSITINSIDVVCTNINLIFNLSFYSSNYSSFTSSDYISIKLKADLKYHDFDFEQELIHQPLIKHPVNICSCNYKYNLNFTTQSIQLIVFSTQEIELMEPVRATDIARLYNCYITFLTI